MALGETNGLKVGECAVSSWIAVNIDPLASYDIIIGAEVLGANGIVLDFEKRTIGCKSEDGNTIEFPMRRDFATYQEIKDAAFSPGEVKYRTLELPESWDRETTTGNGKMIRP